MNRTLPPDETYRLVAETAASIGYLAGCHDMMTAIVAFNPPDDGIRHSLPILPGGAPIVLLHGSLEFDYSITGASTLVEFASQESAAVDSRSRPINVQPVVDLVVHSKKRALAPNAEVVKTFNAHLDNWKSAVRFESSLHEMYLQPDYQRIVGMGPQVIPLLLEQLRADPCWLFWALESITGQNPVSTSSMGNLESMTKAWLEWGYRNGYIESANSLLAFSSSSFDWICSN